MLGHLDFAITFNKSDMVPNRKLGEINWVERISSRIVDHTLMSDPCTKPV